MTDADTTDADTAFACIQPALPLALSTRADVVAAQLRPDNAAGDLEAGGQPQRYWGKGSTLRVRFLDLPDPRMVEIVMDAASAWLDYARLGFEVVEDGDAEIRVTFERSGNWSYLGTEARLIAEDEPTMCLSELKRAPSSVRVPRVVRHEFGHALGLVHEHSTPAADIKWDKDAVYAELCGTGGWSRAMVDQQVFRVHSLPSSNYTAFDQHSIMLYPIKASWTLDRKAFPSNHEISTVDGEFVAGVYPVGPAGSTADAVPAPVPT